MAHNENIHQINQTDKGLVFTHLPIVESAEDFPLGFLFKNAVDIDVVAFFSGLKYGEEGAYI